MASAMHSGVYECLGLRSIGSSSFSSKVALNYLSAEAGEAPVGLT